jgi:integrase
MGHTREKLKALSVERLSKKPGLHGDGGGLNLRVTSATACSWVYRYMIDRKAHEMGLGKYPDISLADARALAADARRLKALGKDPIGERQGAKLAARADRARAMTFSQCAKAYIVSRSAGWSQGQAKNWQKNLAAHAELIIGALPVQSVDLGLVMKILQPLWTTKPETANKLRQRIEAVLDWATVSGHRRGDNPARWKGHLDKILASKGSVRRVEHHAALPFAELPGFMNALRQQEGTAARALEFLILTAARTGEVSGATWGEIDFGAKLWAIPSTRMKAGRDHRVPLSERALAILAARKPDKANGAALVFPGRSRSISTATLPALLGRMSRSDITVHGFRSTFRDWAGNETNYPREVAEAALAHAVGDAAEQAYRRSDALEKRRAMMKAWAEACYGQGRE